MGGKIENVLLRTLTGVVAVSYCCKDFFVDIPDSLTANRVLNYVCLRPCYLASEVLRAESHNTGLARQSVGPCKRDRHT